MKDRPADDHKSCRKNKITCLRITNEYANDRVMCRQLEYVVDKHEIAYVIAFETIRADSADKNSKRNRSIAHITRLAGRRRALPHLLLGILLE